MARKKRLRRLGLLGGNTTVEAPVEEKQSVTPVEPKITKDKKSKKRSWFNKIPKTSDE